MKHPLPFQLPHRAAMLFLLTLAVWTGWQGHSPAAGGGGGGSNTTYTDSTTNQTITTTQTVDERTSTGVIQNVINGGDVVRLEGTLDHSLNDPKVQAALNAALKVLNAEKPPFPQGATLHTISTSLGSGGSSNTTTQGLGTTTTTTLTQTIGPATILIGNNQQTPLFVGAGDTDFNTNTAYVTLQKEITTLTGGVPTVETELLQRTFLLDLGAVYSTMFSGIPVAQAQRDNLLSAHNAIGDVNSRIFRAMLGTNDSQEPQGDGTLSGDMRIFTSGGVGWLSQNSGDSTAGFRDTHEAATVGAEWKVNEAWRIGVAASYVHSDTDFSDNLGSQRIDGGALSAYATWRKDPWYADLLYSAGLFNDTTNRNSLVAGNANGSADDWSQLVSLNLGYVIKVNDTLSTGPYAALTYDHGHLEGYSEHGGGSAALSYGAQSYDSLVSAVGWQANWKIKRSWGSMTPLVRVGWERENLNDAGPVSATLLQSPFTLEGVGRFGGFGINTSRESARYDALSVGAGVFFEIGERWTLTLDAAEQTDFGPRNDFSIALTAQYKF